MRKYAAAEHISVLLLALISVGGASAYVRVYFGMQHSGQAEMLVKLPVELHKFRIDVSRQNSTFAMSGVRDCGMTIKASTIFQIFMGEFITLDCAGERSQN